MSIRETLYVRVVCGCGWEQVVDPGSPWAEPAALEASKAHATTMGRDRETNEPHEPFVEITRTLYPAEGGGH